MSYYLTEEQENFDAGQELDPDKDYSKWELGQMADELLKTDSKRELCRRCDSYGEYTGKIESLPQTDEDGKPQFDDDATTLFVDFPELECKNGHTWYEGEGKARSINGNNPILFENHLQDRRRREIYCAAGTPDPSIVAGLYNRTHPNGRKVNSDRQRKTNGASYYR